MIFGGESVIVSVIATAILILMLLLILIIRASLAFQRLSIAVKAEEKFTLQTLQRGELAMRKEPYIYQLAPWVR